QATIEAMVPSRVLRVTGQQLEQFFNQNMETMKLHAMIGEHILSQFRSRYLDFHCNTPRLRERYEMLLQRCPDIVEFLDLQDIASFLNVHPNTVSKIRHVKSVF
ncbi:MAG: Crp/Fnr family transcriptional regulator, partial [Bacteroidaceae bacterium]|nr:Crp/Fnr family transcriptional regulator [Bacteroidaceae bacterium]